MENTPLPFKIHGRNKKNTQQCIYDHMNSLKRNMMDIATQNATHTYRTN